MLRTARTPFAAAAALVALTLISVTPRRAHAVNAVEFLTSTIFEQDQSSFSGIGLRMRVEIPQMAEGFSVMPEIEWARNKSTLKAFNVEATRKDATLAGMLRYDVKREGWQPYFGIGIGIHFISSELDAPSLGVNNESESLIKGGLAGLGGIKFGLAGKLGNTIELEYHHLPDHSQVKFNWGLSYEF